MAYFPAEPMEDYSLELENYRVPPNSPVKDQCFYVDHSRSLGVPEQPNFIKHDFITCGDFASKSTKASSRSINDVNYKEVGLLDVWGTDNICKGVDLLGLNEADEYGELLDRAANGTEMGDEDSKKERIRKVLRKVQRPDLAGKR